jgi:NAD(P)H-hydrate epimerase
MTILGNYLTVKETIAVEMNSAFLGVSTQQLMENAGKSIAQEVMNRFSPKNKVVIIGGLSGNGGDGFVAARHLAAEGYPVEVIILGDPRNISNENTRVNWEIINKMRSSLNITNIKDSSHIKPIKADIIIDGLIGTSMKGTLRAPFLQLVEAINNSKSYRIAIDVPTGMEADTGIVHGESVNADLTITFHKPKQGFSKNPSQLGELVVANIGIPPEAELYVGPGDIQIVNRPRQTDDHKGINGSLLVVGGNENYSGAPLLAAMGAYEIGLDLVYVAVPETVASAVASFSPSMITVKLEGERLNRHNLDQIDPFLSKVDAVAIGPGLGLKEETIKAVNLLLKRVQEHSLPCLLDADGLKAFTEKKIKLKTPTVLTPHNREFKLLTGIDIKGNFIEKGLLVKKESKKLGGVVLLKGSIDVISDGHRTRFNWTGNPGMTVGGTGDILSGITAGFLAQGAKAMDAASAGAFINGSAGDEVYKKKGFHLLPEDILGEIPLVIERALGKNR